MTAVATPGHGASMCVMDVDDDTLMQRYCQGEAAAFDQLYTRHRGPLFRYLLHQCGERGLAEELFQETWLRVIRARGQWRPGQGLRPWLYQIARRQLIDHWRQRRPAVEPYVDEDAADPGRPAAEAWLRLQDCAQRLKALLGGLALAQRDVFLLKEEAGLTLEQIATVVGSGRETIKSRLRYALQRLRAGLEGCDDLV